MFLYFVVYGRVDHKEGWSIESFSSWLKYRYNLYFAGYDGIEQVILHNNRYRYIDELIKESREALDVTYLIGSLELIEKRTYFNVCPIDRFDMNLLLLRNYMAYDCVGVMEVHGLDKFGNQWSEVIFRDDAVVPIPLRRIADRTYTGPSILECAVIFNDRTEVFDVIHIASRYMYNGGGGHSRFLNIAPYILRDAVLLEEAVELALEKYRSANILAFFSDMTDCIYNANFSPEVPNTMNDDDNKYIKDDRHDRYTYI